MVERKKKWKKEYADERKRGERRMWRNKEENARMDRIKKEKKYDLRKNDGGGGETHGKNEDWSRRKKERRKKRKTERVDRDEMEKQDNEIKKRKTT